jgi:hypothetical protein
MCTVVVKAGAVLCEVHLQARVKVVSTLCKVG